MKNTARWQLTSSAMHGFMGAVSTAYGYTKDLNESLNSIQIVAEKNSETMAKFAENANKAAKALSTTTTNYTDASLIYYQQGLSDKEVEGRTNVTIKLANAAGESAQTASEQLTAIWNNFYDGSKTLEYYADVMAALGASTASSTQEISAGIQKFAAIADTVGLSYEYAASALATITATTRESADVVGTSLRTLFARIQGLLQDEEQDDGTTLNKYSKALAQVGIDIKDTSGELKGMDQILDEMAARWNTLSNAQQMALAQTVAGVRQYTQLITLMENYEFFQENLATAMDSEGTLEKQAQIYANSWEAARKRVRASAEDIYDSLINEDFFIEFDNNLADLLSGLANSIDALGGMKGALNLVGIAFTQAFGDKLAQNLRDVAYNFTVITGKADEAQRKFKESAGAIALAMVTDSAKSTDIGIKSAMVQAEDIEMQNLLNRYAKEMTDEQITQLSNYKDMITQIKNIAIEQERVVEEQIQWTKEAESTLLTQDGLIDKTQTVKGLYNQIVTDLKGIKIPNLTLDNKGLNASLKEINGLTQAFKSLQSATGTLTAIKRQFEGLEPGISKDSAVLKQLNEEFKKLTGIDLTNNTATEAIKQIDTALQGVSSAAEKVRTSLVETRNVTEENANAMGQAAQAAGEAAQNQAHSVAIANEEAKKYLLSVIQATQSTQDWATTIVNAANYTMRLGMMIQGIKNLGSIWSNDDLTTGEKIIQTLTSGGMILQTLIPLITMITKAKQTYTMITVAQTGAEATELIQSKLTTRQKIIETKTIEGNTVAVIANTAAWYANPIFWAVAAITAVVAAFAIYTSAVEKNTQAQLENAKAAADTSQAGIDENKKTRDSINDLYKEYINLQSKLDGTSESKEELAKHTEELLKALGVEQYQVDLLSGSYDKLNKRISDANKDRILRELTSLDENTSKQENAIKYQWNSNAWATAGDYDYALMPEYGATDLDEYDFNQVFLDFMNERLEDIEGIEFSAGVGYPDAGLLTFKFDESSYNEAMSALDDFIDYVKDPDNNLNFSDSENWQNLLTQYEAVMEYDQRINDANQQKLDLLQELAQIEAQELGYDLVDITDIDTINEYTQTYIDKLKELYEQFNVTPETENGTQEEIDVYFANLAKQYLSGYQNLQDVILKEDVLEEILSIVGERNRSTIQKFVEDDNYDIVALAHIDWEVLDEEEGSLENKIKEAYQIEKDKLDAEDFKVEIPVVIDIMSSLQSGKDLTDDQIALLKQLENEYGQLGVIQDRTSSQYIQALRDIREGMEHVVATDKVNDLNAAWDKLWVTVQDGESTVEGIYKSLKELDSDTLTVKIDGDNSNLSQVMDEILNADYTVQVAIEADLQSDIDDISSFAKSVESATSLIQEGFKVAYDDVQALQAVFPDILAEHTITADGMIQLNADIAQSCVDLAHTQITNDKEACKQNILDYQAVLLSKAAAMRQIAEGLAELARTDGETSEKTAEAKAKIEEGLTNFKSACADEQALISEGLATSEISDENQVLGANENAAGTSANNWADAYDSMAKNSADWARIAIGNANAVAKAMKAAQEGGEPSAALAEVSTGGIFSSYGGGFEAKEYSNTYESRGTTPLDWSDYYEAGDYQAAYEAAIKQAKGYEAAAAELTGWIAKIDGATAAVGNLVNSVGRGTKGKGSNGNKQGKTYDPEEEKQLKDIEDRYHEITREIERQNDLLDDISNDLDRTYGANRFKNFSKQLTALEKQAENYAEKLDEAQNRYLPQDTATLKLLFDNVTIKENGELANYEDLLNQTINNYNTFLAKYNAFLAEYSALTKDEQEARKEDYEYWQYQLKAAETAFDARKAALKQYEDTRDVIQELKDNIEDTRREIADNKLQQVEYKLEIALDVKSMRDALRDFDKSVAEIFNDALTHGLPVARLEADQAQAEAAMYPEYAQQYQDLLALYNSGDEFMDRDQIIQDIVDLQGKILDSAEAIVDWANSIEDIIPAAVDAARERFELFTDQLEHNTTVLEIIKELYALQGVTYKTLDGFGRLQGVAQERLDAQVAQAQMQKKWYDEARQNLMEAQAALDSLGGNENDLRYDTYKKARDAYLAEFNEAQEAYLSLAKDAMETAQDMYLEQIEKAVYDFGQVVSKGVGLDLLQDKYDHYIEKDERYFDKVNEAYQTAAWYNKLQEDIDKATDAKTKQRLKELQEEIDMRREGNKLSQYDLDILNAKYEVLQAQMALEDAQNAKNQVRLVRDRQGNWNYQYTADPNMVDDAQQNLLGAENDWYNIAKQQVTDITGEIISTWQECQDAIKEIYSDMTLTDQERSDKAAEIYQYYSDKIKYLEEEKQQAILDITAAGNVSLVTAAETLGTDLTDFTDLTADEIKTIIDTYGNNILDLITADNNTLRDLVSSDSDLIKLFENTYSQELDQMTTSSMDFESVLRQTLDQADQDFLKFQDTIQSVANSTGTSLWELDNTTNELSNSTDRLRDSGLDAASSLWNMIDAAQTAAFSYADMAQSIWGTVEALRALAAAQANFVASQAGSGVGGTSLNNPSIEDYSYEMLQLYKQGMENGGNVDWTTMAQLAADRNIKINNDGISGISSTDAIYQMILKAANGNQNAQDALNEIGGGNYFTSDWEEKWRKIIGFDTGGYTGLFNDQKLAFLHEKELVLNQQDTENILAAVNVVRSFSEGLFNSIAKVLDNNAMAAMALMGDKVSNVPIATPFQETLEQQVHVEAVFPNVVNSNEIQDAFNSIVNDAAQWAQRRKD